MFYVLNTHPIKSSHYKSCVLLVKDRWDDWFRFETQYYMHYANADGDLREIGYVKIGQEHMKSDQRTAQIPTSFEVLPEDCFSLGQSDFYYERLNELGDQIREEILSGLRDLAFYPDLYSRVKKLDVTRISLMREISHFTITSQYQRIAKGHARLTTYDIEYTYPKVDENVPATLSFHVQPESNPPTNIHVIIGRNNVGKTYLIRNMISSIYSIDDGNDYGILRSTNSSTGRLVSSKRQAFANVLCVSFSPFDDYTEIVTCLSKRTAMPFTYIGLTQNDLTESLCKDFSTSLGQCLMSKRKAEMLTTTISLLESDPIFARSELKTLLSETRVNLTEETQRTVQKTFRRLSSGHQVIMLTLTQLICKLTERTFVILDEPENHLHPPLLAAFIRALSELLVNYNGVALIATHSPVILQEVPKSCVWKINRNGSEVTPTRLENESFGATIGGLTREVFELEVRQSGFHKLLADEVDKGLSYTEIKERFNNELGDEALALIRTLILLRDKECNETS